MYKNSKLKLFLEKFNDPDLYNNSFISDFKRFYDTSFNTIRNKKTDEIIKSSPSFFTENRFISDNIIIINSSNDGFYNYLKNSIVIADRNAIAFTNQLYNLQLNNEKIFYIDEIKTGFDLQNLINHVNETNFQYLFAIGGGRTMDFAKFISFKSNLSLISLPSSLATHVYASPKIHALPPIKELGFVNTIDAESSHLSILDLKLLNNLYEKDNRLILSGFGDLMAFINARYDWIKSSKDGNERFSGLVDKCIDYIISKLINIDITKSFSEWIEDYIFIQCLLCNITHWVGSAPASGAEHLFAKCIEDEVFNSPLHGEVVALGVLIFCYIRNKDIDLVLYLKKKFNISNSFKDLNVNKNAIINALNKSLYEGNRKKRYTILNDLNITNGFFQETIDSMILNKLLRE